MTMPDKSSKTTTDSAEQTKLYHRRYLLAVNSPLRRQILKVLKKGSASVDQLRRETKLDRAALEWHLSFLEHGSCVEKTQVQGHLVYTLTQEGKVVDYLE